MPAVFTPQTADGQTVGANAYISVAFFRQYHLDRGRDLTATPDATVQLGIVRATDYIDLRWRTWFPGVKLLVSVPTDPVITQTTEWPRDDAFYDDGLQISGLPVELQRACAEYAKRAMAAELTNDAPSIIDASGQLQPSGQVVEKQETVGPITERTRFSEYGGNYAPGTLVVSGCLIPAIPAADMVMERILDSGGSTQARIVRT